VLSGGYKIVAYIRGECEQKLTCNTTAAADSSSRDGVARMGQEDGRSRICDRVREVSSCQRKFPTRLHNSSIVLIFKMANDVDQRHNGLGPVGMAWDGNWPSTSDRQI